MTRAIGQSGTTAREACSEDCADGAVHPDHSANLARLRRLQGQIGGIEKMISDRRYCVDILTQCRAAASALEAVEAEILKKHARSCLREAMESKNKRQMESKMDELMELFLRQ